jgi:hypothetical protein
MALAVLAWSLLGAMPAAAAPPPLVETGAAVTGASSLAGGLAAEQHISTAQAALDLQTQSSAGNIAGELQSALGTGYAGLWFDPVTGRFHIDIAPSTNRAAAEAVARGAGVLAESTFDPVSSTWAQVQAAAKQAERQLAPLELAQQASVITDPRENRPIVELSSDVGQMQSDNANRVARSASVPASVVEVAPRELQIRPAACSFPYCDAPLRGGVRINSSEDPNKGFSQCTAGAMATESRGYQYILTAGHCLQGSRYWNAPYAWGSANSRGQGCAFGVPAAAEVSSRMDAAAIGAPGPCGSIRGIIVEWGIFEAYAVHGVVTAYPGLYECHQGASGGNQCGTVEAANVSTTITYESGPIAVEHTDRVCATSRAGDSGGPWQYGNLEWTYLTAIHIAAGSSSCSHGQVSIGFEMEYAERFLGVSVTRSF